MNQNTTHAALHLCQSDAVHSQLYAGFVASSPHYYLCSLLSTQQSRVVDVRPSVEFGLRIPRCVIHTLTLCPCSQNCDGIAATTESDILSFPQTDSNPVGLEVISDPINDMTGCPVRATIHTSVLWLLSSIFRIFLHSLSNHYLKLSQSHVHTSPLVCWAAQPFHAWQLLRFHGSASRSTASLSLI